MKYREAHSGKECQAIQLKTSGTVGIDDATIPHAAGDFLFNLDGKLQVLPRKEFDRRFIPLFDVLEEIFEPEPEAEESWFEFKAPAAQAAEPEAEEKDVRAVELFEALAGIVQPEVIPAEEEPVAKPKKTKKAKAAAE